MFLLSPLPRETKKIVKTGKETVRIRFNVLQPYKTTHYHCGIKQNIPLMNYTFEELPQAISILHDKVDSIKDLLLESNPTPSPDTSDLLTVSQAAIFLSLSVPTIYTKVSRKEIPVNKRGKRLYFSKQELYVWIKSGKKTTEQESHNNATSGSNSP